MWLHNHYAKAGLVAALLIILNIHTYSVFPLETVMLSSLEIALVYHYFRGRLFIAAVLGACAVLTRFDAVILIFVLSIYYLIERRDARRLLMPAVIFTIIVLSWFVFAFQYYGTLLPNTAFAKMGFANHELLFVESMWPKVLSILIGNSSFLSAVPVFLTFVSLWSALRGRIWAPKEAITCMIL